MIDVLVYVATALISVSVVGAAANNGFFNSAFTRAFGGIGTQIVSLNFLNQYTNFETFLVGCYRGQVGIMGYFFLISLSFLLIVWVNNLINYRQAIV